MSKQELDKIMNTVDFDKNGAIDYEEFIRVALIREKLFTDEHLKVAFDMFDLDKNGAVSIDEIKQILGNDKNCDKNIEQELMKEIKKEDDDLNS